MMKDRTYSEQLESLLARPALLVDRGFVSKVENEVRRLSRLRRRIFVSLAAIWLLLALVLVSPGSLIASLKQLLSVTSSAAYLEALRSLLSDLDMASMLQVSALNSAMLLLALAAVASLLIREY